MGRFQLAPDRASRVCVCWTCVVFVVCIAVRAHFISEKSAVEGDECTSLSLAYNAPGWLYKPHEGNRLYSAQEMRSMLFADDKGDVAGYLEDMESLWHFNRDTAHASLYYMMLRTVLSGVDEPEMDSVIRWGCGLNLLLFCVSFWALFLLLGKLGLRNSYLAPLLLLLAYVNPLSVSNTLLLREYQLAECAVTCFALFAVSLREEVSAGGKVLTFRMVSAGAILTAVLASSCYLNCVFALAVCLVLGVDALRLRRGDAALYLLSVLVLSALVAVALYPGFFNVLFDSDTAALVSGAGSGFWFNFWLSAKYCLVFLILDIWGLPAALWVAAFVAVLILGYVAGRRIRRFRCPRAKWLLAVTAVCMVLFMFVCRMKETRYIAPYVPLFAALSLFPFFPASRSRGVWLLAVAAVCYTLSGFRITNIPKPAFWPVDVKRVYLYGPDDDERNSLSLLAPRIRDGQECFVFDDFDRLGGMVASGDSAVYVVASADMAWLQAAPGFEFSYWLNSWLTIYKYRDVPSSSDVASARNVSER